MFPFVVVSGLESSERPEYYPCTLSTTPFYGVICQGVVWSEIPKAFNNMKVLRFPRVDLYPGPSDDFIPADFTSNRSTIELNIVFPDPHNPVQVRIDRNAFRSSSSTLSKFVIENCDVSQLDLSFLTGFTNLTELIFSGTTNIHKCLPTMPYGFNHLVSLIIYLSKGMAELTTFPQLYVGLETFHVTGEYGRTPDDGAAAGRVLDWLVETSSHTLKKLGQSAMEDLTEVPEQILSFKRLDTIHLENNAITTVKSGAFKFSSVPGKELSLSYNELSLIEPNAFQGALIRFFNVYNFC